MDADRSTSGGIVPFHTSIPAVMLKLVSGGLGHGRVAAIRSLGRMGVEVHSASLRRDPPDTRSRFDHAPRVLLRDTTEMELLEDLVELGAGLGGPVLITTDDVAALFVDAHAERLRENFRMPIRPAGLAERLSDKRLLQELCAEVGVPTPATWYPRGRDDLKLFGATATFPLVVKSMDPRLLRRRPQCESVTIVADRPALEEAYDRMEVPEQPNLMLQEYIPGGPDSVWMFNGCFDASGDCLVGFTGRKLRQYPMGTGAASAGVCEANPEVHAATRMLMKAVGYAGIVDMGWRLDPRDGVYKLLDVNPRMGATFRLFVATNGLDVVRAQYLDLTGQRVPVSRADDGRRWVNEADDFRSIRMLRQRGGGSYRDWLAMTLEGDERAWFAVDDLRPFVSMTRSIVSDYLIHQVKKAGSRS